MAEIEAWLVGMIQTPARKFRRKYRNVFHKKAILLSFIRTQFYTGAESPQVLQYRHAFLSRDYPTQKTRVFHTYKTAFNFRHLGFTQRSGRLSEASVPVLFEFTGYI